MDGASLSGTESKDSLCKEVSKVCCEPGEAAVAQLWLRDRKSPRARQPGQQRKKGINNTRAAPGPQSSKCPRQDQVQTDDLASSSPYHPTLALDVKIQV